METISDYIGLMTAAEDSGKYTEAKRYGEEALKKLDLAACPHRDTFYLYEHLGFAYNGLGEYSRAIDAYYKAYLIACRYIDENPKHVINILTKLGYNFIVIGNPGQGLVQFQKAEQHYQAYRKKFPADDAFYAHLLIGMAYCYVCLGELAKTGKVMAALDAFLPSLTNKHLLLDYHHIRGEYLIALQEYNEARRAFDECIKISNEVNSPRGGPEARIHLAVIDLLEGRLPDAIHTLRSVLKISRKLKLNGHICESALLLSKCYLLNKETAKSVSLEKRIRSVINKLDISWFYEKIREFDNLYKRLQPVYKTSQSIPDLLIKTINKHYKGSLYKDVVVGKSLAMQALYQQVAKIAPTDLPVLICGGTGTGKEFISRFIHQNSARANQVYLTAHCGVMSEPVLERELFGYTRDSFKGADEDKKGYIELASDGTLLMDEIGCLPQKIQQKLCYVLESKQVWPAGAKKAVPVNTRFLFTSGQEIEHLTRQGFFGKDLFYRLNTIVLTLPALRERRDDIPLLIEHFLGKYAPGKMKDVAPKRHGALMAPKEGEMKGEMPDAPRFTPDALRVLSAYPWPGNIMELENEIRRISILNGDLEVITPEMLSDTIQQSRPAPAPSVVSDGSTLRELKLAFEKDVITRALAGHNGHISRAAKQLGLNRVSLYKKMKTLGIKAK